MEHQIQTALADIVASCRPYTTAGTPAAYIPELAHVDPALLGVCVALPTGQRYCAGDVEAPFTLQSIAKILIFTCALLDSGMEKVLEKVSLEPTAESFNSVVSLETKNAHKPLNPMINSGAIACLSLVAGRDNREKFERILHMSRQMCGNSAIGIHQEVYLSEKATGSRNRALAYFMQSTGVLQGNVEELLDAYFRVCSITMTSEDLACMALVYACDGRSQQGQRLFPQWIARAVKAVMCLCGMYDESGMVAVEVGLPSKSGVGGGILSLLPGRLGIGIYGPALNEKGSSIAGLQVLKRLSQTLDLSIF